MEAVQNVPPGNANDDGTGAEVPNPTEAEDEAADEDTPALVGMCAKPNAGLAYADAMEGAAEKAGENERAGEGDGEEGNSAAPPKVNGAEAGLA